MNIFIEPNIDKRKHERCKTDKILFEVKANE